jgi:hypothetical protein
MTGLVWSFALDLEAGSLPEPAEGDAAEHAALGASAMLAAIVHIHGAAWHAETVRPPDRAAIRNRLEVAVAFKRRATALGWCQT